MVSENFYLKNLITSSTLNRDIYLVFREKKMFLVDYPVAGPDLNKPGYVLVEDGAIYALFEVNNFDPFTMIM